MHTNTDINFAIIRPKTLKLLKMAKNLKDLVMYVLVWNPYNPWLEILTNKTSHGSHLWIRTGVIKQSITSLAYMKPFGIQRLQNSIYLNVSIADFALGYQLLCKFT